MSKNSETIEIRPIIKRRTILRITGDTPLIVHAWSEKAKREMLDKQMKVTKTKGHDAKNPVADFIDSLYWMTPKPAKPTMESFDEAIANGARFGFPVNGIKQAAVSAAFRSGAIKNMTAMRGSFFIHGEQVDGNELVQICGDAPTMREDMVRVGMGTADLRYRGMFSTWYMDLNISYNENGPYTLEQIVNSVNLGGYMCGVGEWRPEKDGQNGMFSVTENR